MARQTNKSHKNERAASPRAQRKSSRLPAAQPNVELRYIPNHKGSSSVSRPVRDAVATKDARKQPKVKYVSAAGIFKKASKGSREKRFHRRREQTPETDLILDLQGMKLLIEKPSHSESLLDGVETARAVIIANARASFDDVRGDLTERLRASRATDESLFEMVSDAAATLSAPLSQEKIQTTFKRDGKRVTEIIDIGKRVTKFKDLLTKEEVKLADYWKQWEDLQDEYVELGIEVFGPEVFGEEAGRETRKVGFKWEMELLDHEHSMRIEELEDEIVDVGVKTRQKMKASEKVSNTTLTCRYQY